MFEYFSNLANQGEKSALIFANWLYHLYGVIQDGIAPYATATKITEEKFRLFVDTLFHVQVIRGYVCISDTNLLTSRIGIVYTDSVVSMIGITYTDIVWLIFSISYTDSDINCLSRHRSINKHAGHQDHVQPGIEKHVFDLLTMTVIRHKDVFFKHLDCDPQDRVHSDNLYPCSAKLE